MRYTVYFSVNSTKRLESQINDGRRRFIELFEYTPPPPPVGNVTVYFRQYAFIVTITVTIYTPASARFKKPVFRSTFVCLFLIGICTEHN